MADANLPSHRPWSVSFSFPSQSVLAELQLADRLLDPVAEPLRRGPAGTSADRRADQLFEGATLRVRELHPCMVGIGTDMAETPDEILRALADPERLAIAGALAHADAGPPQRWRRSWNCRSPASAST